MDIVKYDAGYRCWRKSMTTPDDVKFLAWIVDNDQGATVFSVMVIEPPVPQLTLCAFIDGVQVMALDVGRHTPEPINKEWDSFQGPCVFLDGRPCYYEGSGLMAFELLQAFAKSGYNEQVIWDVLIAYHHTRIMEGGEDDAEEVEGPLEGPERT